LFVTTWGRAGRTRVFNHVFRKVPGRLPGG
jgi:hypothetical protein